MDLRVQKTLRDIRGAFAALCKEKKLDAITVKELCERALINKATFYAHYENLDELIIELEDEYISDITGSIDYADLFFTDTERFLLKLWASYQQNPNGLFLLQGRRSWDMLKLLLEALRRSIYQARPEIANEPGIDMALTYIIYGIAAVAPLHRKESLAARAKEAGRATEAVLRAYGICEKQTAKSKLRKGMMNKQLYNRC